MAATLPPTQVLPRCMYCCQHITHPLLPLVNDGFGDALALLDFLLHRLNALAQQRLLGFPVSKYVIQEHR
jgi:hypothetical protein